MSYPTGGSGYNGPSPAAPSSPGSALGGASSGSAAAGSGGGVGGKGLPFLLTVGAAALGVLAFLLGFLPYAGGPGGLSASAFELGFGALLGLPLFGGLLAGLALLPKQNVIGMAGAASTAGFFALLIQSFNLPFDELEVGAFVLLVVVFVQAALTVVATLFDAGILTAPPARPSTTASAFGGGYGQQLFGQGQQAYPQRQPGYSPAGAYAPPGHGGQPASAHFGAQPSPYGHSQQSYGQGQPYAQQQPSYGQNPPTTAYGSQPQGAPYGAQAQPDDAAHPNFGGQPATSQSPYGAPGFGPQNPPTQPGSPFGGEQAGDPAAEATRPFRPSDDTR